MKANEMQAEVQKAGLKKTIAKIVDYRRTFESEPGKKVLADLISLYMLNSTLNIDAPDALVMAFNEGRRMVVGRILQITKQDAYKFQKTLEEIENAARTRNQQLSATTTAGEQY